MCSRVRLVFGTGHREQVLCMAVKTLRSYCGMCVGIEAGSKMGSAPTLRNRTGSPRCFYRFLPEPVDSDCEPVG